MNRTLEVREAFGRYGTDKLSHNYASVYAKVRTDATAIFEIGAASGASLRSWAKLFPDAMVYGLDQNPVDPFYHERIRTFECNIRNFTLDMFRDGGGYAPYFDLIVDDGSHQASDVIHGFKVLVERCRGLYIIEDLDFPSMCEVVNAMRPDCPIISIIETGYEGDRLIVGQFNRVIEW